MLVSAELMISLLAQLVRRHRSIQFCWPSAWMLQCLSEGSGDDLLQA
jgi:hypothetical protein